MANCKACDDLRDKNPEFINNGLNSTMCSSLKNDTGFKPSNNHNDCTDLTDANDCLVGNMTEELKITDACRLKEFLEQFIKNLHNVLGAIICAICGIWTNIHNLWNEIQNLWDAINDLRTRVTNLENQIGDIRNQINNMLQTINRLSNDLSKIWCYIDFLLNGENISGKLDESDFVAGTGVDFSRSGGIAIKPSLLINGCTYTISGSINVDISTQHWGRLGLTNTGARVQWGSASDEYNKINTPNGNYTLCYIKIKKSKFPWLKTLASTVGTFVNASVGQLFFRAYDGDDPDNNEMTGQWGYSSSSITVPAGYYYLRVSLISLTTWGINYNAPDNNAEVTFRATGLVLTDSEGIEC